MYVVHYCHLTVIITQVGAKSQLSIQNLDIDAYMTMIHMHATTQLAT